jgi:hypothetical protein
MSTFGVVAPSQRDDSYVRSRRLSAAAAIRPRGRQVELKTTRRRMSHPLI